MRLYEIQWIGPPRDGEAEVIGRVADSAPDDDVIKQHARHLFATVYQPGARAVRIIDSEGREVPLWAPREGDARRT
jgi:hypothetical protein